MLYDVSLGSAHLTKLAGHLAAAAAAHQHTVAEARALDALLLAERAREDARVAAAEERVQNTAHEARAEVALLIDLARRATRTARHFHAGAAVAEALKQSVRPFFRHCVTLSADFLFADFALNARMTRECFTCVCSFCVCGSFTGELEKV